MNHIKILKESFTLVFKHRYLWFLGLFLGGGIGSNFLSYSSNWGTNDAEFKSPKDIAAMVSANVKDAGEVLGEKISAGIDNTTWLVLMISILLILLLSVYLTVTAKGAVTWAIVKLKGGSKFDLSDAWKMGHKYFWRKLSYDIIVGAGILIVLLILSIPIILLAIFEFVIPAIILGILFGLAFVVFVVYLSLFLPYSERILFLDDKKNFEAISAGFKFFNKNWVNLVLMYLLVFAVNIVAGIGLAIILIIGGIFTFAIGAAFYFINHITGYVIGGTIGAALLLALMIFGGALASFSWSVITLTYKEVE